jgi:hypothetical protein
MHTVLYIDTQKKSSLRFLNDRGPDARGGRKNARLNAPNIGASNFD